MKGKASLLTLFPVLFSFCIVGFCDIVGISASYIQSDFQLDNTMTGLFPVAVFIGFLFLPAPLTALANRMGCKKTALYGMGLMMLGMLIPLGMYSLSACFVAFALLGMGNVLLQVVQNLLSCCVIADNRLSATLASTQLIRGISAFCGPFVAAFALNVWGDWYYAFAVFTIITLLSALWLMLAPLPECRISVAPTFRNIFSLLKDANILRLFVATVCVAGIDVGMNLLVPKLMMEHCGNTVQDATLGSSVYFAFRTLGVFVGSILLPVLSQRKSFRFHVFLLFLALLLLVFSDGEYGILILSGMVALGCSFAFSLLCSILMQGYPDKINEISLLMMGGMCGGAFMPLAMGVAADVAGNQSGGLLVMVVCTLYLLYSAFCINLKK